MRPMPELTVEEEPTDELIPYANNAKIHTSEQVEQICTSIQEFGFNDPVAVWDGPEGPEIIEDHGRVLAAKRLGLEKLPVIRLDHLDDAQRRAYTHVHNQLTMNTGWDFAKLDKELEALAELDIDMDDFGFDSLADFEAEAEEKPEELRDEYSQNVGTVEYEPKDTSWEVSELYAFDAARMTRIRGLIDAIEDEDLKEFLNIRLQWFCEFNFSRIADYYAYQATADEQRAFEALGLVLLDRDQLIANGFADIAENLVGGVLNDSMPISAAYARRTPPAAQHRLHHQQGKAAVQDCADA